MAKKGRFPGAFAPNYESEGSGSSGRHEADVAMSHGSSAAIKKCINLNPAASDRFGIPTQFLPVSEMASYERKELVLRLKSELEQVRNFQKRVNTKKRTNVGTLSSSSDILSYSHPQNVPIVEKKLNTLENKKTQGLSRGSSGRFESSCQPSAPSTSEIILMKQCETLLKKLMEHQFGWVFNSPVDVVKLNIPDYFTVIKHPMDFGTVKKKMLSNGYSPRDFAADVRLTFTNAMTYNPRGNDVHIMADTLLKFFEVRWRVIEKKLQKDPLPLKEKPGVGVEKEIVQPIMPSKKRKVNSSQHIVVPEVAIRKMTDEEKFKLSSDLEGVLGELPDAIVDFLREQSSNAKETGEDEIEIDINDLSHDALFKLRKLLDDFLQMRVKNHGKAEHCEIELQNEPGLSNSSTELQKGDDPIDGDVEIGGNEPPVSSFPPVEIEKLAESGISVCKMDGGEASNPARSAKEKFIPEVILGEKRDGADMLNENQCVSGLDQSEQTLQKQDSVVSDGYREGESAPEETRVLPDKQLYRAAYLKKRFLDTILKAREKTITQGEKGDPEKVRREKEALEMQKRREKARLQAEAKAAEDAQKRAEAEAAAEAKRKRELEREAARQALLKMEKTVEINENSRFLEDLEMLSAPSQPEQLPSSVDESSPEHSLDGLGSFKFSGTNPLEQLGLYMKLDDDDEEGEPPRLLVPSITVDVEEGEID